MVCCSSRTSSKSSSGRCRTPPAGSESALDATAARRLRTAEAVSGAVLLGQAVILAVVVGATGQVVLTVRVAGSALSGPLFLGTAAVVLAAFAGIAHLVTALPGPYARMVDGLRDGRRDIRFLEYSFTASITVVLVAALNGVTDAAALVPVYALTAGAALVLLVADRVEVRRGHPQLVRSVAAGIGIVPWGVVALGQVAGILAGTGPPIAVRVLTLVLLGAAVAVIVSAWRERPGVAMVAGELRYLVLTTVSTTVLVWSIATGVVGSG